jgi:hypothetical protein
MSATNPHYVTGSASGPTLAGNPWSATSPGGDVISAALGPFNNGNKLELQGNTEQVWTGTQWTYYTLVNDAKNTAVQMGFDTVSTTNKTAYSYGETLLTDPGSYGWITITFSEPVEGIGFDIASLNNANFVATVDAFNAAGTQLGTYVLNTNGQGGGGQCYAMVHGGPGANCLSTTPAPFVGIDDLMLNTRQAISSIRVETNDNAGFAVDTLQLLSSGNRELPAVPEAPEPAGFALATCGIVLLVCKGRRLRKAPPPSTY